MPKLTANHYGWMDEPTLMIEKLCFQKYDLTLCNRLERNLHRFVYSLFSESHGTPLHLLFFTNDYSKVWALYYSNRMPVCMFVPKDLANHWTEMFLLHRVASHRSWEGLWLVLPPSKEKNTTPSSAPIGFKGRNRYILCLIFSRFNGRLIGL